jgi:hypothetical protein
MEVLPIMDNEHVAGLAESVSNVCNATLSLLFTAALFIYGFYVNRKQAWRTDGGTAAFGAGALFLALGSTMLTFLYIPSQDQYTWMQGLIWAVIMWQTFMGWWWWVGAGMGVGEMQELLEREKRRQKKKRIRGEKAKQRKERATKIIKGVSDAFAWRSHAHQAASGSSTDEDVLAAASGVHVQHGSGTAIRRMSPPPTRPTARRTLSSSSVQTVRSSVSGITHSETGSGAGSSTSSNQPGRPPARFLEGWYKRWRHAHTAAVHRQAAEQVVRINQVYGKEIERAHQAYGHMLDVEAGPPPIHVGDAATVGWGLGAYGVRETARGEDVVAPHGFPVAGNGSRTDTGARTREHEIEMRSLGEARDSDDAEKTHAAQRRSMWWWGPLQRWRLQDSTRY